MLVINAEIRPAWRSYWAGFAVVVLLLLLAILAAVGADKADGQEWINVTFWNISALCAFSALGGGGLIVFKRFSWKFTIDDDRISRHYGIVARNQQSVRIKDLRSVELDQSMMQRILGIGDLAFYSAGSADAEVRFQGIKDPFEWRDKIDSAADRVKDSDASLLERDEQGEDE